MMKSTKCCLGQGVKKALLRPHHSESASSRNTRVLGYRVLRCTPPTRYSYSYPSGVRPTKSDTSYDPPHATEFSMEVVRCHIHHPTQPHPYKRASQAYMLARAASLLSHPNTQVTAHTSKCPRPHDIAPTSHAHALIPIPAEKGAK